MSSTRQRSLGLLAATAILVAACGGTTATASPSAAAPATAAPATAAPAATPTTAPSASAAAAQPQLVGTAYKAVPNGNVATKPLVVAEWQSPDTFNPYYSQANVDYEVAAPALLGLINTSNDLKYYGDMVTEVPLVSNGGVVVNGTGMTVTYKLKPGMKWSDGSPITCKDLEANWKWVMDPAQTGLAGGTIGYEDITAIDTTTDTNCVVTFKNVFEGYLGLFSPLLPAAYVSKVPVVDAPTKLYPLTDLKSGVYSGPYIPTDYKADAQLNYTVNPNYATIHPEAKLGFPSMIFKFYGDSDAMKAGFDAGEYDLAMDLNHSDIPSLAGKNPLVKDGTTYEQLSINNKTLTAKFGEADLTTIKQALALAINKTDITGRVLGGTVDPISNPVSPQYWFNTTVPDQAFDAAKANSLLDAAGWVKGADGIRTKNGKKLSLDFCTTTRPYRVDSLAVFASNLKEVGIEANTAAPYGAVKSTQLFGGWDAEAADTPCNLIHGTYDVSMFAWVSPLDPLGSYNVYTCQGIPDAAPHNGQNNTRTCDPAVDKIWNDVKGSVDFATVGAAMAEWQKYYNSNVVEVPLFMWKDVYLVNPKLQNVTGNPTTSGVLWNVQDWWLQP
jgi:peptide/nickel transport system substrate-binding protein